MKPLDLESCVYCPRLCRHVCPVAVGSGRESATPTAMMTGVWRWLREESGPQEALESASLCTRCGACESHCKLNRPVSALLAEAMAQLESLPQIPTIEIHGEGSWVALETDSRRWAAALSKHLNEPVARIENTDELGASLLDHPTLLASHLKALKSQLHDRQLMVTSHRALEIATRAGLQVHHLSHHIEAPAHERVFHPCSGPRLEGEAQPFILECCGARGPLQKHHGKIADEVAASAARELGSSLHSCPDSICSSHLRSQGAQITDPIDWLLSAYPHS
jgi:ferredoxin